MTQELNWCGWPIGPGESYYGGREEHISETLDKPPARGAAKQQHYEVITESHLAAVFGQGALRRPEAAKRLGLLTGTHRTTAYRALRLNGGRFSRHLHRDGAMLSWR